MIEKILERLNKLCVKKKFFALFFSFTYGVHGFPDINLDLAYEKSETFRVSTFLSKAFKNLPDSSFSLDFQGLSFKENVEIGVIYLKKIRLDVSLLKLKTGGHRYCPENYYFKLVFYIKKKAVAHLHFVFDDEISFFRGLIIDNDYRGQRLSKPLLKFYFDLCLRSNRTIKTTLQKKPIINLLLLQFGLIPSDERFVAYINKCPSTDKVEIFAPDFSLKQRTIKSQNLKIFSECFDESQKVFLNTEYFLKDLEGMFVSFLKIDSRNIFYQ